LTPDESQTGHFTITAVGDMMFDRRLTPPRVFYHYPDVSSVGGAFEGHIRFPFMNTRKSVEWLAALDRHVDGVHATSHLADSIALDLPPDAEDPDYPFSRVAGAFQSSDIVFGNLECPLVSGGRRMMNDACYSASPAFAGAMAKAGVRVVSLANNHRFDYGEPGFLATMDALRANEIAVVGAGPSLEEARAPALFAIRGITIAFLAYSMIGPDWIFATDGESGIAPLNPMIVGEDIRRARAETDIIVLSLHWGIEGRATPWPRLVDLAHDFIDCGADVILGHHSHVPGSVEIYHRRPIFYSLGNFSFGHDHRVWGTDMIVNLHCDRDGVKQVELLPIRGRYQPAVVEGELAVRFHRYLSAVSRQFGTAPVFGGPGSRIDLQ
jgi:poly-gamma-glutamate capsule biosynthesis protein CapA/YwtB (metallophosphatase superfamily)